MKAQQALTGCPGISATPSLSTTTKAERALTSCHGKSAAPELENMGQTTPAKRRALVTQPVAESRHRLEAFPPKVSGTVVS